MLRWRRLFWFGSWGRSETLMSTSTLTSSTQRSSIKSAALITSCRNACCRHKPLPVLLPPRPTIALAHARALGGRLRCQSDASERGDSTAAFEDRDRAQDVLAKPSASPPACRSAGLVGGGCVRGLSGRHDVSLGGEGRRRDSDVPDKDGAPDVARLVHNVGLRDLAATADVDGDGDASSVSSNADGRGSRGAAHIPSVSILRGGRGLPSIRVTYMVCVVVRRTVESCQSGGIRRAYEGFLPFSVVVLAGIVVWLVMVTVRVVCVVVDVTAATAAKAATSRLSAAEGRSEP